MSAIEPSGLHAEIWGFLVEHFVGVENRTNRAAILQRFNLISGKNLSDRFFRQIVSDLVTDYQKAICTLADGGYYIARTGRELDAAAAELESKGAACFDRARRLRQCEPIDRQESLF